jgi:iron complex outermembrane recepter protein
MLQNRLRFNAAAFYSIYEDIQLTIPTATGGSLAIVVQNAGEAIVRGAELEVLALPFSNLQLTSSIGITNAKYTEFDDATDPTKVDNQLPGVPTYSMNFGAQYGWDLGSSGNLTALANWTHIGRSGTDVDDSRILRQGKHGELDSQLVWALADGKTELSLWGNNLLGREYLENGINFGSSFGNAVLYYNDPRTYGVEVRRTF